MESRGGTTDEYGHVRLGGIGQLLEREIEQRTGYETRATVLGHIQRGGTPTAFDRVLATRLGIAAIDAAHAGSWGCMPALHGNKVELVPLSEAVAELRTVPDDELAVAEVFFGKPTRTEVPSSSKSACCLPRSCLTNGAYSRAVAATTTMNTVRRKASKALIPSAQAAIHHTSPTVSVTRSATYEPRRSSIALRTFVTALNALFMARSAPESCGGIMPIWRANSIPS